MDKTYICIDLKSFYASVECVIRKLDPLTTNLVVANPERTEKTICLAVTPALKSFGIPGRARLFEVIQKVKIINNERKKKTKRGVLLGETANIVELNNNPNLALSYIIAPPQMAKYIEYSTKIYDIYLKYFDASDIHVYSIDEVFIDASNYLKGYGLDAKSLTRKIIQEINVLTGITATGGIGTNMYLAKVAMDIEAKHVDADEYGVRIAELNEITYRKKLWTHVPITDFWRVGNGYARRLEKLGIKTMGDVALCSIGKENEYYNEDLLYKEFGINAELLIDHAWGYEPTSIKDIKSYKPQSKSVSAGQVLHCGYDYEKTKLIVKEMIDLLSLDLVDKQILTNQLVLSLGYDNDNLTSRGGNYDGEIASDMYGRQTPKASHGSINLDDYTSSPSKMMKAILSLYDRIMKKDLMVKRLCIVANNVIDEEDYKDEEKPYQLNMFTDYEELKKKKEETKELEGKEHRVQKTILELKKKYGKNAVIKGMNIEDGGTTIERNEQIGGHKA